MKFTSFLKTLTVALSMALAPLALHAQFHSVSPGVETNSINSVVYGSTNFPIPEVVAGSSVSIDVNLKTLTELNPSQDGKIANLYFAVFGSYLPAGLTSAVIPIYNASNQKIANVVIAVEDVSTGGSLKARHTLTYTLVTP